MGRCGTGTAARTALVFTLLLLGATLLHRLMHCLVLGFHLFLCFRTTGFHLFLCLGAALFALFQHLGTLCSICLIISSRWAFASGLSELKGAMG